MSSRCWRGLSPRAQIECLTMRGERTLLAATIVVDRLRADHAGLPVVRQEADGETVAKTLGRIYSRRDRCEDG